MQARFGFAASGRSIQDETQADCFAGAGPRWVADGKAEHVSLRSPSSTTSSAASCCCATTSAATRTTAQAHGSYFDRVSAFYEGFDGGVGLPGRLRPGPALHRRLRSTATTPPTGATRRTTTSSAGSARRCRSSGLGLPEAFPGLPGPGSGRSTARRAGLRGRRRTATSATAPTTRRCTSTRPTSPSRRTRRSATSRWPPRWPCRTRWPSGPGSACPTDDAAATRSAVCLTGWYEAPVVQRAPSTTP
jgi:hypothetical protein